MVEYAYIVDFAPVLFIYLSVRNTGEASEKPLRKRVERVRGKPGVYSTIWCLCYKTNKLAKRRKKGAQLSDKHWWHTGKGATSV